MGSVPLSISVVTPPFGAPAIPSAANAPFPRPPPASPQVPALPSPALASSNNSFAFRGADRVREFKSVKMKGPDGPDHVEVSSEIVKSAAQPPPSLRSNVFECEGMLWAFGGTEPLLNAVEPRRNANEAEDEQVPRFVRQMSVDAAPRVRQKTSLGGCFVFSPLLLPDLGHGGGASASRT